MKENDRVRIKGESLWRDETGTVTKPPTANGIVTVRLDSDGLSIQVPEGNLEILQPEEGKS